jgi:Xaa-Pro aminopeptidase
MEWILMRSKLPEQGKDVLLFDGGQIYFGYYSDISGKFIVGNDKVEVNDFSHWMQLPPFPKK